MKRVELAVIRPGAGCSVLEGTPGRNLKMVRPLPADAQTNLVQVKAYDANGNLVSETDAQGHVTRTGYDVLNRPVTVTANYTGNDAFDPGRPDQNVSTVTSYDAPGQAPARTDALSHQTTYAYDAATRLTTVNDQPYSWDNDGNLLDDGQKRYTYGQAGQLGGDRRARLTGADGCQALPARCAAQSRAQSGPRGGLWMARRSGSRPTLWIARGFGSREALRVATDVLDRERRESERERREKGSPRASGHLKGRRGRAAGVAWAAGRPLWEGA
jgi:YD repeat-containing protein